METTDILDGVQSNKRVPANRALWTIRLLVFGLALICITFLFGLLWQTIGLSEHQTIWLALSLIGAFGVNVAGFVVGFSEQKKNRKRARIGIIGNACGIAFFIAIVVYSLVSA